MLVELQAVEQRYQAVREVLDDGARVTDVALRYGVARQTVHEWLRRYAAGGMGALADHSSRPGSCPHQMPAAIEATIVDMRRAHPSWGPRTIGTQLRRNGLDPVPGRSSIYRALVRHRLIDPHTRKRKRSDYKRWERSRSMELWQTDVMGGVRLTDGTELSAVTGIDDHSRFCVIAKLVRRATARPVCEALTEALRRHGIPDAILSDNGKVFTGRFGLAKGPVLFDRICNDNGIRHLLTAPYSPTTTGKIERLHKTMRAELFSGKVFSSVEDAQSQLDEWVRHYNFERPHQGIGDVPPIERFKLARQDPVAEVTEPPVTPEPEPIGPNICTRRVRGGGYITIDRFEYHVGKWLNGEMVVINTDHGIVTISHNGVVVATHAQKHKATRPVTKASDQPPRRPASMGNPVLRRADGYGAVSFAGFNYHVGTANKRQMVEVAIVGNKVQFSIDQRVVRVHPIKHDRSKEYGAFAFPKGKPRKATVA